MQHKIFTRLTITCFFLLVCLTGGLSMAQPVPAPDSVKDCTLKLDGIHQAVSCLETLTPIPPVAVASCGAAVTLSYEDQYYNLGCSVSGFQGYFALSHWAVSKIKGDGGVDVTGAPNSILVEGANNASVLVTPESEASFRIAIPAYGFVSFDWSYIGGSNLLDQAFWIDINGERTDELHANNTAGNFFFGPLEAGDILALNAASSVEGFKVELANFEFHSNAMGVIERRWEATDEAGHQGSFTQWVSINKPELSQVTFPANFDGFEYPVLGRSDSIDPEWTGFPVIDGDGLLSTSEDQFPLIGSNTPFDLTWKDESIFDNGQCITFREWTVTDRCGNNVLQHTQIIKFQGGCPDAAEPLPFGQQNMPGAPSNPGPIDLGPAVSSTQITPVTMESVRPKGLPENWYRPGD